MPSLSTYAVFLATAMVLLAIPGPAVLYVVTRSIEMGRAGGVSSVAGITTGTVVHVTLATAGLSSLILASKVAFDAVKFVGAAYLIFLGVQAIRHRHSLAEALGTKVEQKTVVRIVVDGFTVGVTNPKVIVFFAAMLPQFVDRQAGHIPVQIIVLGAIFAGIALISDST